MARGSFGQLTIWEDFLDRYTEVATDPTGTGIWTNVHQWPTGVGQVGEVSFVSVNEGSFTSTNDEPGGILAVTTDVGDDDNFAMFVGPFNPADGGMEMECRFKLDVMTGATTPAVFVGFTETLAEATPVMPAEFATATMTYNGTGGMIGFNFDGDGTTDDWRALAGDAGAALATVIKAGPSGTPGTAGPAAGVRAGATLTADRWYVVRVVVGPDGKGECWFGDIDGGDELQLIAESTAALGTGDEFYAVLMVENRTAAARILETDYFHAHGWRDWAVD